MASSHPAERLTKIIARSGAASRRGAERLIKEGRVLVDGKKITRLWQRVKPGAQITVDGQPLNLPGWGRAGPPAATTVALHKPGGYVTTMRDPRGRPTVAHLLRQLPSAVRPAGRLDYESRGLLLATDDGQLAQRLTHPKHQVVKTYRVKVQGKPAPKILADLRQGIPLADGTTAPAQVELLSNKDGTAWLEIKLREGRQRQVRRMLATVGHPVLTLIRVGVGPVTLGNLPPGQWRYLTTKETQELEALFK